MDGLGSCRGQPPAARGSTAPSTAPSPSDPCHTFRDTSCTRCFLLGSSKQRLPSGIPSGTSFPSSVPFSRILFVNARVSTPASGQ